MVKLSKIVSAALILSCLFNAGLLFAQIGPYFPQDASSKGLSKTFIGFISGTYELTAFSLGLIAPQYLGLFNYNYSYLVGNFVFTSGYLMFGFTSLINSKEVYIAVAFASRVFIGFGACVSYATLFAILFKLFPQYKGSVTSAVSSVNEFGQFTGPLIGTLLFSIGGFFLPIAIISGFSFACLIMTCIFMLRHQNQNDAQIASDLQKNENIVEDCLPSNEIRQPKLWNFIQKPEIILASIPFATFITTQGLFSVFLAPYLGVVLGVKADLVGLYFTPSALVALVVSPVFGWLVNRKLKWVFFFVSPVIAFVASGFLCCAYFLESFRSNAVIVPALIGFGFCFSVGFISGMLVLDEVFQINRGNCLEDDTRVLMSSWTQNICYFLGRWLGAFLIGGLIFDHLGYEGVLIAQTLLHLISAILTYLCYIRTTLKIKADTHLPSQNEHCPTDEQNA